MPRVLQASPSSSMPSATASCSTVNERDMKKKGDEARADGVQAVEVVVRCWRASRSDAGATLRRRLQPSVDLLPSQIVTVCEFSTGMERKQRMVLFERIAFISSLAP